MEVKRHIVYTTLIKGLSIIIGFLNVPLFLKFLGSDLYGIWITLLSVITWFNFFDIGLGNGMRNHLTIALSKKDMNEARKIVSTTYALVSLIFGSVLLIFLITNRFLDWHLILNTNEKVISTRDLLASSYLVFGIFFLRFIVKLIGTIYLADKKPAVNSLLVPLGNLISLVMVFLLLKADIKGDFFLLATIIASAPLLVMLLISFIGFGNRYSEIRPKWAYVDWSYRKRLLNLGLRFFALQIAATMIYMTSPIIISQALGPSYVTDYNIAFKYLQLPAVTFSAMMVPIWSSVTDAFAKNDTAWLKRVLRRLNKLSLLFVSGLLGMLLIKDIVTRFWIGDDYIISNFLAISITLSVAISIIQLPYSQFINGIGKLHVSVRLAIINGMLHIPLSIVLCRALENPAGVVLSHAFLAIITFGFQRKQISDIMNNHAKGIWDR